RPRSWVACPAKRRNAKRGNPDPSNRRKLQSATSFVIVPELEKICSSLGHELGNGVQQLSLSRTYVPGNDCTPGLTIKSRLSLADCSLAPQEPPPASKSLKSMWRLTFCVP